MANRSTVTKIVLPSLCTVVIDALRAARGKRQPTSKRVGLNAARSVWRSLPPAAQRRNVYTPIHPDYAESGQGSVHDDDEGAGPSIGPSTSKPKAAILHNQVAGETIALLGLCKVSFRSSFFQCQNETRDAQLAAV